MHTPAEIKKKKAKVFYAQSDDCVCFGCCKQRGREIYVLVLKGARAFDPCNVIFLCQGQDIGCLIPFKEKKKIKKNNLTQVFWTGRGGGGLG